MGKIKIGDRVRITDIKYGHKFKIGEIVTILEVGNDYKAENQSTYWWIRDDEFELIENKDTKKEDVGMRYKVGDKVRIRKDLVVEKNYNKDGGGTLYCSRDMVKFAGKIATISKVNRDTYRLDIDLKEWHWSCDMLEPVEEVLNHKPTLADKLKLTANSLSEVIIIGDITISIPKGSPIGIATKHPDDVYSEEVGISIATLRMIEDAEKKGLI